MKLIRLKIGTRFRSLPEDFEIVFSNADPQLIVNEPICLVGINGSGKSNVLEAIAEIFEYLDLYFLKYTNYTSETATIDQFIVEYLLPIEYTTSRLFSNPIQIGGAEFAHIKVKKLVGRAPIFSEISNNQPLPLSAISELLPSRIIGYSSGQNELLSIPFRKINFKYYHSLREQQRESGLNVFVIPPRLNYMEYSNHALVLLANYLIPDNSALEIFRTKLGIDNVFSFELFVSKDFRRNNSYQINQNLNRFIEFLISAADENTPYSQTSFRLRFIVTDDLKRKFKEQVQDSSGLHNALVQLNLLNLNGIPINRMNTLLAASDDSYFKYRQFDFEPNYKLFSVDKILIRKQGVENPIDYRTLSDGEHQFLFIIGLLMTFNKESVLFLLDEPETHFNPLWKYDYVEIFKKISDRFKNQILLTTHDPVLISGLSKDNVIVFRKSSTLDARVFRPDQDLKGMGGDAILTSEIFGLNSTLDQETLNEIIDRRKLLVKKEGSALTVAEDAQLEDLNNKLNNIDFYKPFEDPLYKDFVMSIDNLDDYKRTDLTDAEIRERTEIAKQIMERLNQRNP